MKSPIHKIGFIDRFFIKWETRSLGANINRLIAILPCVIYMDKARIDELLERANNALQKYLNNTYIVPKLLSRISLRISQYQEDENLYLQDRGRLFDILLQNIQLYGVIIDIFHSPNEQHLLDSLEVILKERFDEQYTLNAEGERLLSFQEKYSI